MSKSIWLLLVVLVSGACCDAANLVEKGKPAAVVVIGPKASSVEQKAASELVRYIKLMTGAELATVTGKTSGNRIIIGTPDSNLLLAGFDAEVLGPDGYALKTLSNSNNTDLLLVGGSDRGTLYAVYHLLSDIWHIGFFWDGVKVPKHKSLGFPELDVVEKPRWPLRQYNQGCAFAYNWMFFWPWDEQARELEWAAWHRQNRLMWPLANPDAPPPNVSWDVAQSGLHKYEVECRAKVIDYAHQLGLELLGVDHVYNTDPWPEQRVSNDPAEEDRIMAEFARKTMADYKAKDSQAVWFASGWALFNPGWRVETAKTFFDSIGSDDFYISDCWGEGHPIYKQYDYFGGKSWTFGILHSFGGNAHLHGHLDGLVKRVQAVESDPKASKGLGLYINPEIIRYNELYFDLAARLAWDPRGFDLDDYLADYSLRRYGSESAPVMKRALGLLAASVYGTNDLTPGFYQTRMGVPLVLNDERFKYLPPLRDALALMLSEQGRQQGNLLYARDVVDVAKQSLAELFNHESVALYRAFTADDRQAFDASASNLLRTMNHLLRLLATCKEYQIGPIMDSIRSIPGVTEADLTECERYLKDVAFTLYSSDYSHRDMLELNQNYYLPRVKAYIGHLRSRLERKQYTIDAQALLANYVRIEQAWVRNPLPEVEASNTWEASLAAAEQALGWLRQQEIEPGLEPATKLEKGGFETGTLKGWRQLALANVALEVQQAEVTEPGAWALHFATDRSLVAGDHTFGLGQELRLKGKSPTVGLRYFLEEYSTTANARLMLSGYDKEGLRRYLLVYYWGGDSWDYIKATPDETLGFYAASLKQPSETGVWHELVAQPMRDLDELFGEGTSESLEIDKIELAIGCWTAPHEGQHISGYIDEITVSD